MINYQSEDGEDSVAVVWMSVDIVKQKIRIGADDESIRWVGRKLLLLVKLFGPQCNACQ